MNQDQFVHWLAGVMSAVETPTPDLWQQIAQRLHGALGAPLREDQILTEARWCLDQANKIGRRSATEMAQGKTANIAQVSHD